MVTGFIRLNGMTVGAVANRWKVFDEEANVAEEFDGSLSANGAQKAADFVRFCDAFNIPVLTLTNVSGFKASDYDEKHLASGGGPPGRRICRGHGAQGKCDHRQGITATPMWS